MGGDANTGVATLVERWASRAKVIYLIGGLAGHWESKLVAGLASGKVMYLMGGWAGQLTCFFGDSGCENIDMLMATA